MMTIDKLNRLGCDTKGGLERCFDDEEFYLSLIPQAFDNERYDALEKKLSEGDTLGAFEEAHAIKGVLANLGLTPLSDPISEITERSRNGTLEGCKELFTEVKRVKALFETEI